MVKPNELLDRDRLVDDLFALVQELPTDQLVAVSEYAKGLRMDAPSRGTAQALLEALTHSGPLQFESGELDRLLAELETMRQLDMEEYD